MYAQGHLFFLREQTLLAQPFDADRLELVGEPVAIAENVTTGGNSGMAAGFSVSATGILAYQVGPAGVGGQGNPVSELVWIDRNGKRITTLGGRAAHADVDLAPEGQLAAVSVFDAVQGGRDIWLYDLARGLRTRFTFHAADDFAAIFSRDGSRVAFNSRRKGHLDLFVKASSGATAEEELFVDGVDKFPVDWSPDGRFILYFALDPKTSSDLWVLPVAGDRKPRPLLQTPFAESGAKFSPDGRWVAYVSSESGRNEVYVMPCPGPGGKWQVSLSGGNFPHWRGDGAEIFYLAPDNRLMAVTVSGRGTAFAVASPEPLFQMGGGAPRSRYDVSPDGRRFLVNTLPEEAAPAPITLLVNWPALVSK